MNFRRHTRGRRASTNFMVAENDMWKPRNTKRLSRLDAETDNTDDSDEPMKAVVTNWAEELFGRRSVTSEAEQQDVEIHLTKKQTLILSTLVPDEVLLLDRYEAGEPYRFVGVLMMADVSGYTALSERYNNTGKGGTYRLTVTLNTYLGALIEIIYSHGGDIIKFAGDAFLALWKTEKRSFLCHTIHSVITCALVIQHSYAKYETDVKVNLKVKLAISAGNLMFSPIGAGIDMNYVIFGLPVLEAKLAESLCQSGEVKITPSAWAHCYSRNYDHILHGDGHVTILSILYDPRDEDVNRPFLGFGALLRQVKKTNLESIPDFIWEAPKNLNSLELTKKYEVLNLRKAILKAEERDLGSKIRNFMIRPVLTQIDAHQPLEYLTEMRQVSVLFITLKPKDCPPRQFITIVNNSYRITCEIVYKSMGCVNKIILFDKDVMILVIFGLRGFKHESEAQAALKCAYSIKKSVAALDGVQEVSIGVTTGQVYCGVVGHPLRREFTVIGGIVNKAARLMCSFRNRISCDESTFVKSKMSKNSFTLQPQIELKGIGSPGRIYEYTEEIRIKEYNNIPMIPPLLDRIDETEYFNEWLSESHSDFDALLFIGESRIGKTRLLEWLARLAQNRGLRVCQINLTSIHSANRHLALSQMFNQMVGLDEEPTGGFIKEQLIVEMLKEYDEDLCYLNNVIKSRFAYHEGAYALDEKQRIEKAKLVFKKVISSITYAFVLLLDDLQNLDASSWEFISLLLPFKKIYTVLTVTRGKFSNAHSWLYDVFIRTGIRKLVLGPLTTEWISALACQILDVDAVPNDLCLALCKQCKGMPGLVESFIVHLFSSGAIETRKLNDEELDEYKSEELVFPDVSLLKPKALDIREQELLDSYQENESVAGKISVCIITNKMELDVNVQNMDTQIMIQIDTLTPYQQLLLKIASVIGNIISRDLLENIMYENNPLITAKAIKRLFVMKIFHCATSRNKYERKKLYSTLSVVAGRNGNPPIRPDKLDCECSFDYDPETNVLPKYAYCKVMRFRNKNSRNTCYELLPMNQKKEFHSRIVHFLESKTQKCPDCGGTLTIVPPLLLDDENYYSSRSIIESQNQIHFLSSNSSVSNNYTKAENLRTSNVSEKNIARAKSETIDNNERFPNISEITRHVTSSTDDLQQNTQQEEQRVTITSLLIKNQVKIEDKFATTGSTSFFGLLRSVVEATQISDWHRLGVVDSLDEVDGYGHGDDCKNSFSFAVEIEKGLSQTNFRRCTCMDLNILINEQLIHHALQAEMKIKAIDFLLNYCYLCLLAGNYDSVLEKLEETEELCKQKTTEENPINKYETKVYHGRIYSLRAAYSLLNGQLYATKSDIERAMRIYGVGLTKGQDLFKIKKLFNNINSHKHQKQVKILKADSVFCLNVATLAYAALKDEKSSRICSFHAINLVQKVECRASDMFDAFTGAIQLELDRGINENTVELERILKHMLRRTPAPIKATELFSLGKLFLATFRARLARSELAPATRAGFRAIVVSNSLQAFTVSSNVIPDLFYILLCRRRIDEAIDVVKLCLEMSRYSNECETWYYALCMDLILDAGFQLEPAAGIAKYSEFSIDFKAKSPARRRLLVNLWNYWLRVDAEKKARKVENEIFKWLSPDDDDASPTTLLSALRLAEGMLESLARKMDDLKKVVDLMELRSIADRELNAVEKNCKLMRVVHARWLRLKATALLLSGRTNAANSLYNQAFEEGRQGHNHLEAALARAALAPSRGWIQNARNAFPNWQEGFILAKSSWPQILYNITTARR